MKVPTPFECDTARKVIISMDKYGGSHTSKYVAAEETIRLCELTERSKWKD